MCVRICVCVCPCVSVHVCVDRTAIPASQHTCHFTKCLLDFPPFLNVLCSGAFANVYRGTRLSDQCSVAVKFMEKPRSSSRDYQEKIETMRRELNIMQSLDHPDVVELLGKFEDTASCIIVQEL